MRPKLSENVLRALTEADRTPGWNSRAPEIRRFEIAGNFGRGCTLYVVPFRRFAYQRQERLAAEFRRASTHSASSAKRHEG